MVQAAAPCAGTHAKTTRTLGVEEGGASFRYLRHNGLLFSVSKALRYGMNTGLSACLGESG